MPLMDPIEELKRQTSQQTAGTPGATSPGTTATGPTPSTATGPAPIGLGLGATPGFNPEDVVAQVDRVTSQDSPLMRRAKAEGIQFANRRGLLNSSLAGQASQNAVLNYAVPLAAQASDQAFRYGLQGREQDFQAGESELERQNRLTLADKEIGIQREKIASDEGLAALERDLRLTLQAADISANDRRGAESLLNNAFNDYENSIQSILANPDLPASERNKLLTNAKNMLSTKITYINDLYSTDFDWPDNPFRISSSSSSTSSSTSSTSTTSTFQQRLEAERASRGTGSDTDTSEGRTGIEAARADFSGYDGTNGYEY